ncbi:uncharacterized protein ATC70_012240 [Mucor velutinosus]|uniref:Uncharacterized protein n=1 Tax=Mucor velutinosus TaxID=708070 RepID=A0AAN7D6U7_9FUNG|nr:hypothetical protein ATC70_012240 [Mucor velutinosus]
MFDFLLKPFSPLTAFYNSLVVVNCAFQQFEIKQLSYDPIQADQIVANYNYDPFAGQDVGVLVMNDIEEDFTAVDKLMEDVDDDYCLTHCLVENEAVDANVDTTAVTPAHLVGCLRIFVANVVENITCSFIFGALLSCDYVLSEKRSIEDFVHVKSEELKNNRILRCRPTCSRASSSSSPPKMRGFGVDFGVPGIKYVEFATVPDVDSVVPGADFAAVVPVYSRWKAQIKNEVARRRESYIRFNREHEDIDGWGFIRNDFSIQAAN